MKESLLDILRSHPNWEADIMEPATNKEACIALDREMKQAAAQFVEGLLPFADSDRWQRIVEYQINEIFTDEPPHTHFNKEKRERYSLTVWNFALKVTSALKNHAFDISQLDRVTQWRLGHGSSSTHIEERLAKEEARQLYQQLKKQGYRARFFRELCSSLYTVLAYKVEASQTTPKDVPPPSAGQNVEAGTNTSTRKIPGRKKTTFAQFIINKEDTENVLDIIRKHINKDNPLQAALLIFGAIEAGRVSSNVTAPCISKEFGVNEAAIKPHLTKYRRKDFSARMDEIEPYKYLFLD